MKKIFFLTCLLLAAFASVYATAPPNDTKANATVLDTIHNWSSSNALYTTVNATTDGTMPSCWNGSSKNVWFRFQATGTKITSMLKTGGSYGTIQFPEFALTDSSGTVLGCQTYAGQYDARIVASPSLQTGTWYYLMVDNANNTTYPGTFTLSLGDTVGYNFKVGAATLTNF